MRKTTKPQEKQHDRCEGQNNPKPNTKNKILRILKKAKTILEITEEITNGVNVSKHSTNKTALFNRMQQNWKEKQQSTS